MRKAVPPERIIEKHRKNFRPSLSMQKIVQRLLGSADRDTMKLLINTSSLGM